jgi:hypothetical protein
MAAGRGGVFGRLVEYDMPRGRVWILGQRCHHGATGSIMAAAACAALLAGPAPALGPQAGPRSVFALAAAGGALMMAHDWKDRSIWFERGRGSQQ